MGIIAEHWIVDERVHLEVQRATGLRRATGLIGRPSPRAGTALLIDRCASVHGLGMRAALDVVFCAADGTVLSVKHLQIGGFRAQRGASFVFELAAGEAERLKIVPGLRAKKSAKGG